MTRITKHQPRPWQPERKAQARRRNDNNEFYNSQAWRKYRRAFIDNNPLCVVCDGSGLFVVGTVVDHIVPINEGGSKWDIANLQTLCDSCHAIKSGREAHTGRKRQGDGGL